MKHLLSAFIFIQLFTICLAQSNEYVNIKFTNLNFLNNHKLHFNVNGVELTPDTIVHQIMINENKFDTIIFTCFNSPDTAITKFIAGETYFININACSFYELIAKNNPSTGMVRFEKTNNMNDTIIGYCEPTYIIDTLISKNISEYFQIRPSAMCFYSSIKIGFRTASSNKSNLYDDNFYNAKIKYHFLHGEKLTIKYDELTNEIYLTIDSYLKE